MLTKEQKTMLLDLARNSIQTHHTREPLTKPFDKDLSVKRGVFVSLHKHGELRGCIGYITGYKDLISSIIEMSCSAAFRDPRFNPVKQNELADIDIEISILSEMVLVNNIKEIEIGRDGLYLDHPYGSGLLLPQVPVEWGWDIPTFLKQICYKSGLSPSSWSDDKAKLYRFSAEIFSESKENSD
jgi:AmmeMemoRadiSam system protein A